MRDAIVEAVYRAAPFPGAKGMALTPGNIVDALIAAGVEPYLVLSACCAASGLPAARRAWLEGPLPSWPPNFDVTLCRQLGCCPVAQRKGQWVVAYSDPELAVAAESLGLPDHVRCLALPRDLERFFASAPADVNPFDQTINTDADGELFVPQSQLDPGVLNTDKVEKPVSATADDSGIDDVADDDDDDLDLYVDRLADQLTQQQARPTVGTPPPSRRRTNDAPPPPAPPPPSVRPVRPATTLSTPGAPSSPSLTSRTRPATTRVARESPQDQGGLPPRRGAPGAPSPPSRANLLVGGAAVCVAVAAVVWLRLPRREAAPTPIEAPVNAVVVKDGALDFSVAQQALVERARTEAVPAAAMRQLSDAIKLDPNSTVARTALLERARLALDQGFLTQVDNDLERLRRRADVADIRADLDALAARRASAPAPSPSPPAPVPGPVPPSPPSSSPSPSPPSSAPPAAVLPGDGLAPVVPDHGASGFIPGLNTAPPDEAPPP